MSADQELTIILTLKDRASFTFRWMAYANAVNFPFKILIADGGADETVPGSLSQKANYPDVDFEYIRYPYDRTFIEYYDKVMDALANVETRFVVLADNDDFFIVSGLNQSVEFLQSHPDYSACRGEVGAFLVSGSEIYDAVDGVYGDHVEFVPGVYHNQSLEQDSARERLGSHFLKYAPTWYEVHRTDQLREAFRVLRSLEISDLYLAELLISGFTVIAGKVKREPDPYLFRQSQTPDSGFTRKHDGFDRMLLETWSADFQKFVEAIANALASADRSSADEAREFVREIYRSYIGSSMIQRLSAGEFDEAASSDHDLKLRSRIRRVLRELYLLANELTGGRLRKTRMKFVTPVSDEEFKSIREFLAAGSTDASVS